MVDRLREIADDLRQKGFTVSIEVRDEVGVRPAYEIAHIADRVGADLIIAGSRGLSTIGGLIPRERHPPVASYRPVSCACRAAKRS